MARAHTGKSTKEKISGGEERKAWHIQLEAKTGHSLDLTFDNLGIFKSAQSRVWRDRCGLADNLVEAVQRLFSEDDLQTLERVGKDLFKRYYQILARLGRNYFEVEHAKTRKWQRESTCPSRSRLIETTSRRRSISG